MCSYSPQPYPSMGSQSPRDGNFILHDFNELHADSDEGFDGEIDRWMEFMMGY